MKLPCLSIRQPHVELILSGKKRDEHRTWKTNLRGLLAIHASSQLDREALADHPKLDASSLVRGAVVGLVEVTGYRGQPGDWGWRLKAPVRFEQPRPWKGAAAIFYVDVLDELIPEHLRAALAAQA